MASSVCLVPLAAMPLAAWASLRPDGTPSGEEAARIAALGWILFIGAAAIFLAVLALTAVALRGPARARRLLARPALVVAAGIAFPLLALTALLAYVFGPATRMAGGHGVPPAARIEISGELWWWRVRYLDPAGQVDFETANEIHIPVGQPVEFLLKSDNVIHSFWIPELAGKVDMIPGRVNRLRVLARTPGTLRGLCAEYCGAQHARMRFDVRATTPAQFEAWRQARRQPARQAGPTLRRGEQLFRQACAQCHAVRGTPAMGTRGPDLTHVGSRASLAAGTLPNGAGALAGWIAGGQHIKPGNGMPAFDQLPGEDLRALASYLDHLK